MIDILKCSVKDANKHTSVDNFINIKNIPLESKLKYIVFSRFRHIRKLYYSYQICNYMLFWAHIRSIVFSRCILLFYLLEYGWFWWSSPKCGWFNTEKDIQFIVHVLQCHWSHGCILFHYLVGQFNGRLQLDLEKFKNFQIDKENSC